MPRTVRSPYDEDKNWLDSSREQTIQQAEVSVISLTATITDAQIKSMTGGSSQLELLTAPGDGKLYVPLMAVFSSDFSAGVYDNISDNDAAMGIRVGATGNFATAIVENNGTGRTSFGAFFSQAGVSMQCGPAGRGVQGNNVEATTHLHSAIEDEPMILEIYNGDGALGGGNEANTLNVMVLYTLVDLDGV